MQLHRSLFAMHCPCNNGDYETPNVCWSAVEHATTASGERPSLTRRLRVTTMPDPACQRWRPTSLPDHGVCLAGGQKTTLSIPMNGSFIFARLSERVRADDAAGGQLSSGGDQQACEAALSRSSAHAPAFNRILPGQSRLRHETGAGLFRTQKHRSHSQIHQNGGNTL